MDFKTKKEEIYTAKFFYAANGKGAFIELKTTTNERLREFRAECTEELIEYPIHQESGQMKRVVSYPFNEQEFLNMILDESICTWGGWSVDGGPDLECTLENKVMLVSKFPDFAKFYTKSLNKHSKDAKKKFGSKSVVKNSKTTPRTTSKRQAASDV